jgi:hypothetical protein
MENEPQLMASLSTVRAGRTVKEKGIQIWSGQLLGRGVSLDAPSTDQEQLVQWPSTTNCHEDDQASRYHPVKVGLIRERSSE